MRERNSNYLTGLSLQGDGSEQVTKWLQGIFRSRFDIPKLVDLQLAFSFESNKVSHVFARWLTELISTPYSRLQPNVNSTSGAGLSLTRLSLRQCRFKKKDWASVLRAIGFSNMEILEFTYTNFSYEQLDTLIYNISELKGTVPLRILDLSSSSISSMGIEDSNSRLDRLNEKAPEAMIKGLRVYQTMVNTSLE
jgi:hypothetical protein